MSSSLPARPALLLLGGAGVAATAVAQAFLHHLWSWSPYPFQWDYVLFDVAATVALWLVVLRLPASAARRLGPTGAHGRAIWLRESAWAMAIALAHRIAVWAIVWTIFVFVLGKDEQWLAWDAERTRLSIVAGLFASLGQYVFMVAVFLGFEATRHARARVDALTRAELDVLRVQLHPHFLSNALNTVASFVGAQDDGQVVLERLGRLLRRAAEAARQDEVPLEEELEAIGWYLDIERIRFGDRLEVDFDVAPDSRQCLVPSLILQPLAENAIKHGISRRPRGGRVTVEASRQNGTLAIVVRDAGEPVEPEPAAAIGGIGLTNVRERIMRIYGEHARFSLDLTHEQCRATLEIPVAARNS